MVYGIVQAYVSQVSQRFKRQSRETRRISGDPSLEDRWQVLTPGLFRFRGASHWHKLLISSYPSPYTYIVERMSDFESKLSVEY